MTQNNYSPCSIVAKEKDGTVLRRLVIPDEEKARVFEECHSAPVSGHTGRDNTLKKIREWFYWPVYYKDTMERVRYKCFFICQCTLLIVVFKMPALIIENMR